MTVRRPSAVLLALAVLLVFAPSALAAKPVPPPPAPKIVAATRHPNFCCWVAIASDGTILSFRPTCTPGLVAEVQGNVFGGPPPSPIAQALFGGSEIHVILENGDIWMLCGYGAASGYAVGNLFASAGLGVRSPGLSSDSLAPPIVVEDDTPEAVSTGVVK